MKIYALLVGITDYTGNPLYQCLNDVDKINDYINSIKSHFEGTHICILKNENATKAKIVDKIKSHLYKATGTDIALLYFSGHGALEYSKGIFQDEYDQLMDCLVCYSKEKTNNKQLLSGKELRYLFQKMPRDPHLITIVDACHSGDIVRSGEINDTGGDQVKRLSGVFEEREFKDFVFAKDSDIENQKENGHQIFIPFKNSIHIAACLSSESSWENLNGGVFTSYLIRLLEATEGKISYNDIGRWAKISLANVTDKKQTPIITQLGEGHLTPFCNWLNIHDDTPNSTKGWMINNAKNGWHYNRGSLLGIQKGMTVHVELSDNEIKPLQILEPDLEFSKVEIPINLINQLDFSSRYAAWTEETIFNKCAVFFNEVEKINTDQKVQIEDLLQNETDIVSSDSTKADFWLNSFNDHLYFSLPKHPFQPLAQQIKIRNDESFIKKIGTQLEAISKWHHFYSLENPGENFDIIPIRVEAKTKNEGWKDVTNSVLTLAPHDRRTGSGFLFQQFQIRVKNISAEKIFVGVLTLNSDMSITSEPFNKRVIELAPKGQEGDEILFYEHKQSKCGISLDAYKEIYGWEKEWFYYKFIFNNFDDFSNSLQSTEFFLPALEPPFIPDRIRLLSADEKNKSDFVLPQRKKWGTAISRVEMINSNGKNTPLQVIKNQTAYLEDEKIGPFIKKLYPEIVL